ncbi:hypothetical protein KAH94_01890 [bacterium]|nr:hypothetical protein [bacterium]
MNITILSVFPAIYDRFLETSLVRRAREAGVVNYDVDAYSSFVQPGSRIDAPTFGHGAGMLIKPKVVQEAIENKEQVHGKAFKVFFSPHGKPLNQALLRKIAKKSKEIGHLMLLPARYEGMDARVEDEYADEIVSVGDFVLMGGDIPAMMLLEGALRLIPGVVGKKASVEHDSFTGTFVDHPEYTEPVIWKDKEVPPIIRSGNHAAMQEWRLENAAQRSVKNHFDWVRSAKMTQQEVKIAKKAIPTHYVALMHGQVLVGPEAKEGTTSVTSIDIHDVARSSKTFGIEQFFIVTPLGDQQRIVQKLLDFWQEGIGITYNPERYLALKDVRLASHLDEVIEKIEKKEGQKPLIVTTSARDWKEKTITFHDQAAVWDSGRPVLFLFGTGQGMSDDLMNRSDFVLLPVVGFSTFNHLSVRSAVAIILDRWIGINRKKRD